MLLNKIISSEKDLVGVVLYGTVSTSSVTTTHMLWQAWQICVLLYCKVLMCIRHVGRSKLILLTLSWVYAIITRTIEWAGIFSYCHIRRRNKMPVYTHLLPSRCIHQPDPSVRGVISILFLPFARTIFWECNVIGMCMVCYSPLFSYFSSLT